MKNKEYKKSSFQSTENIQKKGSVSDRSVSHGKCSFFTLDKSSFKAIKDILLFPFSKGQATMKIKIGS